MCPAQVGFEPEGTYDPVQEVKSLFIYLFIHSSNKYLLSTCEHCARYCTYSMNIVPECNVRYVLL